jgi:type IV pilus assembly protein PilC
VLVTLADYMDEDNEVIIKSMMSLLEPLILVVLGGVVGFVAMSLFLPLFDLTAAAGAH